MSLILELGTLDIVLLLQCLRQNNLTYLPFDYQFLGLFGGELLICKVN